MRQALDRILMRPAKGDILEQLKKLGDDPKSAPMNVDLLAARMFVQASSGNLEAYKLLMLYWGKDTEENRKERESVNADRRRDIETQFKMDTMASRGLDSANVSVNLGTEDGQNDVVIYLPAIEDEADLEMPEEEEAEEPGKTE